MKKIFFKFTALLLIIGLNWFGLSLVGETTAFFNDLENANDNSLAAGTLDFSLYAPGDFSLNFTPSDETMRLVWVENQGTLGMKYKVEAEGLIGSLCDKVNVTAKRNGEEKYQGSLNGLSSETLELNSGQDEWNFFFSFGGGDPAGYFNTPCQFDLVFKGWQDNKDNYEEGGFNDIEKALTHLTLRQPKEIVLNEILPNPIGDDCQASGVGGEWIELYNQGDEEVDLAGWYVEDEGGIHAVPVNSAHVLGGSTIIGAKGSGSEWLVVVVNGCVMNNDGDQISLRDPGHQLIDFYAYSGAVLENKSHARYPDGSGPWYDPVPTPGGPNLLAQFNHDEPKPEPAPKQQANQEELTEEEADNFSGEKPSIKSGEGQKDKPEGQKENQPKGGKDDNGQPTEEKNEPKENVESESLTGQEEGKEADEKDDFSEEEAEEEPSEDEQNDLSEEDADKKESSEENVPKEDPRKKEEESAPNEAGEGSEGEGGSDKKEGDEENAEKETEEDVKEGQNEDSNALESREEVPETDEEKPVSLPEENSQEREEEAPLKEPVQQKVPEKNEILQTAKEEIGVAIEEASSSDNNEKSQDEE